MTNISRNPMRPKLFQALLISCAVMICVGVAFAQQEAVIEEDQLGIQNANDLYYAQKYEEAVVAYQALLKTPLYESTRDAIRINLGRSYMGIGEDALALQLFHEVIKGDPNGSYATQAVHQIGSLLRQRYRYQDAIVTCKQLANQYPNTQTAAIARYLVAQYAYADGNTDEAIVEYLSFLNDFPTSPYRVSAISSLVQLYRARQQYTEAENLLQDYLRQSPDDANLMEDLAGLYKEQGKHAEALRMYQSALARNPQNANILRSLGELYAEQGQRDLAINQWSQIIQQDPNQPYRYQQLGEIYTAHQMYDKAVEAYETAIRMNPRSTYLYTQLADVYVIQGKIDTAVDTYLRALKTIEIGYSGRDAIIERMGEIYEGKQRQGLFQRVIGQLEADLRSDPQNAGLVLSLAEVYFHHGDYERALDSFKRLHQVYPADRGQILEKYAQVLERNQRPEVAAYYQAITTLFPNLALAWNAQMRLTRFYVQTEQWQEALMHATRMTERSSDPSANLLLAHIWLHGIRDVDRALEVYLRVDKQPLNAQQQSEVKLGIATCYMLKGNYAAAENILRPLVERPGKLQAEARKRAADALFFKGEFEAAKAAYKGVLDVAIADAASNDALDRVVLIQSNSDYTYLPLKRYAEALQKDLVGESEAALALCQKAIEEFSTALIVDDLWMLVGDIQRRQKEYEDAITAYEQVIGVEKSPIAPEAKAKVADIYRWQLKDLNKALENYTALIEAYPESVVVAYARQQIDALVKEGK